ncbi:4-(cytidine 5'-diphospho)-2-C-methyl-D-erythritol kinase [Oleiagrimonas sp.]|jgi:4-diphosphocytidyl-2-C-methyl-D-erythritol kinase|uniref:4-(cytidine 5'-diphospho)-2-C-methyl-D-erythritol kinase n=1 Tax=Oleiagrimonas sp. TaxID=2010330 RepID=UPI002613955B|nr:4-(cytidine 5'-diphospho)-2-C-methyl-D-erythritol kinase [Oleiagrimonas sp.]MDA3912575.1 4-(cytidine 5'-diphospho)-2-C-methyl-D-erythritol kinase [Oleiagrimonas sp.]
MSPEEWSSWPAPAKLNLFLRITGRRADGYHLLQTVFRLLDWGDQVRLRLRTDGRIVREAGAQGVSAEEDLAVRAAQLLQREAGGNLPGVDILIDKRIPIGGGLGGGSSDAATVLVALDRLWKLGMAPDRLAEIGLGLGADVPVFVHGRSAWATGVGERLEPLCLPPASYVIVDPGVHVSTQALFQAPELTRHAAPATISGFMDGGVKDNVFAPLVRARHARVAAAMDWLQQFGPARLTGTGACVFLEVATRADGEAIAARCPKQFKAFVADGVDASPLLAKVEGSDVGA